MNMRHREEKRSWGEKREDTDGREGDIKHSRVKLELVTAGINVPRNRAIYFAEKICLVMVRCCIFFQSALCITWSIILFTWFYF